jgi:hypothetical protein
MMMGTLGQYLHDARLVKNIDLRDAAQQTRISLQYLRALEDEDFSKLPGEVFVRGFLKNYSRFLNLDESEVMKRYAQLNPKAQPAASSAPIAPAPKAEHDVMPVERETPAPKGTPVEPFVWGAVILIVLFVFLFSSLPSRPSKNIIPQKTVPALPAVVSQETATIHGAMPEKLYLEVAATEDTWLLVRTDDSPQKKAVLKKGESLTWSANQRFVLGYGRTGALKLVLNGAELTVNGTKEAVVRDLVITRSGIQNQPAPVKQARPMKPKPQPRAEPQVAQPPQPQPQQPQPQVEQKPAVPPPPAPAKADPLAPLRPPD